MDWSIQDVARLAGTTSRTLRHYDDIGLLAPSSVGSNGYRRYDEAALVRLQRILLLRQLGLGLSDIADVLARQTDEQGALQTHLALLRQEQERLARQIAAVESTIEARRGGEQLMAQDMFDGFDHTQYESEVVERWGSEAYAQSDRWWRGLGADERAQWQRETASLASDWTDAAARRLTPETEQGPGAMRRALVRGEVLDPLVAADDAEEESDQCDHTDDQCHPQQPAERGVHTTDDGQNDGDDDDDEECDVHGGSLLCLPRPPGSGR